MQNYTQLTSTSLLQGLRDSENATIWQSFVERYRPVILGYAKRLGLTEDDAEDVAQIALLEFSESYRAGRYDRSRGRLRSWLFGIVRNQSRNLRRRNQRSPSPLANPATDDQLIENVAAEDDLARVWEDEWHQAVLRAALTEIRREVQETTYRAFERFALQDCSAADVARELGLTTNAVFGAKRRILARLREVLPMIEDTF